MYLGDTMSVPYDFGMTTQVKDVWPYADNLREIRGALSVERAAGKIEGSRGTWHKWEKGIQRPTDENLKAIVQAFKCPPDMIGYEPPQGWELVPAQWIRDEAAKLDRILDILERRG